MRGTKRAKAFVAAVFLVVALVALIAPHAASAASIVGVCYEPWRGSALARIYTYGRACNSADENYVWMEVHTSLLEYTSGNWYVVESAVDGGEDISYLNCGVRHLQWLTPGWFKTASFHEWDYDGCSYEAAWMETGPVYL